ncbi:GntR family transcriptional regulator [Nitratidesulfovibrio sp. D1]|uniref:GntR family transcriptional regulator n=1 Tax=Nitratidesulfovibrio sp. D1 TaxID=3440151 RepID=UPI003EBAAD94
MARLVKQSLGQEVTRMLKRMIIDGELEPGQRLVEDRLAAELGISRTPLREALHRLEQEGLLQKRSAGGYVLRPFDAEEVEEAVQVRALLEARVAALAARRAGPDQVQALRANLAAFRAAAAGGDLARLAELNTEFHLLLRAAGGSMLLARLLDEIEGVVERIIRALVPLREAGEWSDHDHARIVAAIEAGDADGAAEAMRAHVLHGGEAVLDTLRQPDGGADAAPDAAPDAGPVRPPAGKTASKKQ